MANVEHGVEFVLSNGRTVRAVPVAPHTFRIRLETAWPCAESPLVRYGILRHPEQPCDFVRDDTADSLSITTEQASLRIDRQDGQLSMHNALNQEVFRTAAAPIIGDEGGFGISFALTEGERLYGLGDAEPNRMRLRGVRASIQVVPKESSSPIPYVMSSRGWAILINTTWPHAFDVGSAADDRMTVDSLEGELDFYLFYGSGFGELLDRYTDIAGKPRLLPVWAYGLTYIRDMLTSDREVLDDVLKFREEGIPCDMIGLGSGWTEKDKDGSTRKKWNSRRFSTPFHHDDRSFTFTDILRRHGFKLGLLTHCFDYDLTACEERQTEDPSLASEQPQEPWYEHLRKFAHDGVASFRFSSLSQIEPAPDRTWANGMSGRELGNLYPVLLGKQVHEGFAAQTGQRPFIHSVIGYTGIQSFSVMESGKYNSRGAAVLRALNLGLSGHAHAAPHINVDVREGIHSGFLQPWSLINSGSHFRNPCLLDKSLRATFRKYARLRYRLMPYLYSAAHVAARTGMPITRAMPLLFPDDPNCEDLHQQYMLGDFLLVGVFTDRVYLPAGRWIDYWTGEPYDGGQTIVCTVPDDAGGPLFVRDGAILPLWPEMDFIGQVPVERLILHMYPRQRSQCAIYEDDGATFAYLRGEVAVTTVDCEAEASRITVRISRRLGSYAGMPVRRDYELCIYTGSKPSGIRLNDKPLPEFKRRGKANPPYGWQYDRLTASIRLLVPEAADGEEFACLTVVRAADVRKERRRTDQEQRGPGPASAADSVAPVSKSPSRAADAGKRWLLALQAGEPGEVEAALLAWWQEGMRQAKTDSDWRLHLFNGCTLLVRHAERRDWAATEVFGSDMELIYMLQSIRLPEEGYALLQRLVRRILQYARPVAEPTVHPVVREALAIVERELERKLSLQQVAERTNVHPFYLSRLFKQQVGQSFSDYVLKHRMERARTLLDSGLKVYEAAALSGFRDTSHFSRVFAKYWGAPPAAYKPLNL